MPLSRNFIHYRSLFLISLQSNPLNSLITMTSQLVAMTTVISSSSDVPLTTTTRIRVGVRSHKHTTPNICGYDKLSLRNNSPK